MQKANEANHRHLYEQATQAFQLRDYDKAVLLFTQASTTAQTSSAFKAK